MGNLVIQLELQMEKSNSGYVVTLNQLNIVDGKLRTNPFSQALPGPIELRLTFLDENKRVINRMNVDNPLIQKLDEYNADNQGSIRTNYVLVTKASVNVRIPFDSCIKYMTIEVPDKQKITKEMAMVSLDASSAAPLTALKKDNFLNKEIMYNGSMDQMINFIILGDGYTASEQTEFLNEARNLTNYIFSQPAYAAYKSNFNVIAIQVISNVSGAATDPSHIIDNYFGSSFNTGGIERLLAPTKISKVFDVLNCHFGSLWDQPLLIVNSTKYGGSGGKVATVSTEPNSPEIAMHELGHSFVGLKDEYWSGSQYASEGINMTKTSSSSTVKWKSFIGVDEVGVYPYESPGTDWYRPHQNCKMRFLYRPFCAVCLDAHYKKIQSVAYIYTHME